ncbi:alpha-mannosidase [Marinilactibacillus sp. XAAS-LB27]|uniref:alpha-mannosidase n=1 Tax=Marinilactibacillus sp. XAAS-LB27 TaxID=3114538 RepID=UPI002E16BC32|nr:alpha-mannosidase [Marinilactibacillus sp. XAAS-LB27]
MKTVHIISHSHWDREWYMPYERHHMLLVELLDDVLELFETDPEFKSFYLDGQTIILDDYLEVRPEKESLVRKYINEGKLKIGPFYILQDAFLTSSESNVRNMLIGHQESKKWGEKTDIGYYPDTFGNVGQTPQLMKQLGFDLAAYGRGVKPTGFANQSSEQDNFISSYSEMNWQGVDDSVITGLLFANWYSNGNEVPTDKKLAKVYWDQKLEDAEKYASTDQLLFMNGCDHQPVQKDLSKAIELANELYPDYQFIHSDFPNYISEVLPTLPTDLDTVKGELTSQETEGWYTLTNTASSRVYLKQENARISRLLEKVAEPLASMAFEETGSYPHDILDYAWKTYMQNHPHDSICGCSVDEVHEEMMTRFQKAENVADYVIDSSLNALADATETLYSGDGDAIPLIVFNSSGHVKSELCKIELETEKIYFSEKFPTQSYEELLDSQNVTNYKVLTEDGEEVTSVIRELEPEFNYELPKNGFRKPYMTRKVEVELFLESMESFSWRTLFLVESKHNINREVKLEAKDLSLENQYLKLTINENGTLKLIDKTNQKNYDQLFVFEDTGDIGNEYVYKSPENESPIFSQNRLVKAEVIEDTDIKKTIRLFHELNVPISADEQLLIEQKKVVEFRNRKAQRSEETEKLKIISTITLIKNAKSLRFKIELVNKMKDHRLRVLFPTGLSSEHHFADAIFETVKRPNQVSQSWTNPENPQRTHHFVQVKDQNHGVILAPEGLNEYEILDQDNQLTMALTLFRAVGEMGDWGYFPTPGAQCLDRTFKFEFSLFTHGSQDEKTIQSAIYDHVSLLAIQTNQHTGLRSSSGQFLSVNGSEIAVTAVKRQKSTDEIITRHYNLSDEPIEYHLGIKGYKAIKSNILEEDEVKKDLMTALPKEIITLKWKKE